MDRFSLHLETAKDGASDVVHAAIECESGALSALRGYLYQNGVLYVGLIETPVEFQRKGAATQLLLRAVDTLRVSTLAAGTVSELADELFAKVGRLRPNLILQID